MSFPALFLKRREDRRLRAGHPWVYSNEVDVQRSPLAAFEPGQQAEVRASDGHFLGMAYVNPRTLISARVYSRRADEPLDRALLARRVARALALRERLFENPQYRLVHGEGDGLPGLVVDRYGDFLSAAVLTGILGGYTTFSSMQLDASKLAKARDRAWAAGYLIISVLVGLAAAAFGAWLAR